MYTFEHKLALLKCAAGVGRVYSTGLQGDAVRAQQGEGAMNRIQKLIGQLREGAQSKTIVDSGNRRIERSFYGANKGPSGERVIRAQTGGTLGDRPVGGALAGVPNAGKANVNRISDTSAQKPPLAKDMVFGQPGDLQSSSAANRGNMGQSDLRGQSAALDKKIKDGISLGAGVVSGLGDWTNKQISQGIKNLSNSAVQWLTGGKEKPSIPAPRPRRATNSYPTDAGTSTSPNNRV